MKEVDAANRRRNEIELLDVPGTGRFGTLHRIGEKGSTPLLILFGRCAFNMLTSCDQEQSNEDVVEHTKLVTPSELEDFADRRDSEPVIPELIALLINLSVSDLTLCRIPYGDLIGLPGLDGMIRTESGFRQFVPKGSSYWEIGRGGNAQGKATDDYRKRTATTSQEDKADATFVFVTPRSRDWDQPSQAAWIERRKADGWREIKIVDGIQLCDWLREFPAVGKWLLQCVGLVKGATGFQTPAQHWMHLTQMCNKDDPPLPPGIFLVGRESASQHLDRLFRQEIQQVILAIESENDAEDFIAAFLQSLDEPTRRAYSSRCLFISDAEAWQTFSNLRFSHVLVASPRLDLADYNEQLHLAARARGHGIIFSVSGAWSHGAEKLVPIMSPSRSVLEKAFVDAGYARERAAELSSAGAQNLAALKRFLRGLDELPPYATWENARLLAQASLAGKWNGRSAADIQAMEIFLGKSYGEWIEAVRAETLRADTPLIQRNEAWKVVSRGEAWSALGPRISDEDLDRFGQMTLRILSEKDPQFDLPKEERYAASIHEKTLSHSRLIREGVSESLALLGTRGSALSSVSRGTAEGTARLTVRKLLRGADWQAWASLNDEMPLLAEAAPDEFLDAVEEAVADPATSPFIDVFRQEGSGVSLGGWNYIAGVLWALETLAWHPDYLGRVTILLGDLASIDPGGTWSNRPRNSLVDIFLPWHAQTLADLSTRKSALESLLREQPEVGWSVLMSLLPSSHGTTTGTRKPIWRTFIPSGWKEAVTVGSYWDQVRTYAAMCTEIAAQRLDKLIPLVDQLPQLPDAAHSKVIAHLASEAVIALPEEQRLPLWESLRDIVTKHRKFADAQWAMPADRVVRLEEVANKLAPRSHAFMNRRLFSNRDFDLYEEKGNFEQEQKQLDASRQDSVRKILLDEGIEGVIRFAQRVEAPLKVGNALGAIENDLADTYLLPAFLSNSDATIAQLVSGFVWRRFWIRQWTWVDQQLSRGWTTDQTLAFLLLIPSEREGWQRAEALLGNHGASYWACVQMNPWIIDDSGQLLEAAEKLTLHGQPAAAVDCLYVLSHKKASIPMPLASAVLLGVLRQEEHQRALNQNHVIEVIQWLQQCSSSDSEDLFSIEWSYLQLLNRISGGEPRTLERRLASSPSFFCEVVAAVFRSEKEDKEKDSQPTEAQKRIAQNAYRLLHGWQTLPGSLPDGSFSGPTFVEWLGEAKRLTKESGHFKIAMDQLGQALAHAPPDPGGLWIHKSVATALDAKDVPEMRRAFTTGLFNMRGVHGFSHGEEERRIAADYRQKAKALSDNGFHRLADSVRQLAESYEHDAQRESERDFFS